MQILSAFCHRVDVLSSVWAENQMRRWQTFRWLLAGLVAKDLLEYVQELQQALIAERALRNGHTTSTGTRRG